MQKIRSILIVIVAVVAFTNTAAQNNVADVVPTNDELQLYELIMQYRQSRGLHRIPLSPSLTYVAQVHARDVVAHYEEWPSGCNMHSWSGYGPWNKCDYYRDHRNMDCMHSKPRELTPYRGKGYEISHYFRSSYSKNCTPEGALSGWQSSSGHNAVIINHGIWSDNDWKAIGVGMYEGYACVWFGEETDPVKFRVTPRLTNSPSETEASQPRTTSQLNNDRFADMERRLGDLQRQQPAEKPTPRTSTVEVQSVVPTTVATTEPNVETEPRPEVVTIRKSDKPKKGEKQQREPRQTVFTRFYDHSGYYTLRYFTMGYTYSFVDHRHMVNASLMDFRLACVGFSPLCAEVSASPWDKRVAYKPTVRIYLPAAKCFAFVPYGGVALDATYLGQYLVKNYDYDKDRDFYLSAVAGLAFHLSAAAYVPMDVKVEYRHPIITPTSGGLHSQGVYIGAQLYFGSIWDKKK